MVLVPMWLIVKWSRYLAATEPLVQSGRRFWCRRPGRGWRCGRACPRRFAAPPGEPHAPHLSWTLGSLRHCHTRYALCKTSSGTPQRFIFYFHFFSIFITSLTANHKNTYHVAYTLPSLKKELIPPSRGPRWRLPTPKQTLNLLLLLLYQKCKDVNQ